MAKAVDTGKSVHLSASAGSGKTRALKDRYLALLDVLDNRGLNIDQAVAITFTEKAAAEIKERVMHDLSEAMLKKIIRGRQDLRISTIHSFCMNLLKRYPLEAGLPPDFGVLDVRDQTYKIQRAIEDALEESDGNPDIMAPLRDFTAGELIAMIEFLLLIRSRLKRIEIDAGGQEGMLGSVDRGMGVEKATADLGELIATVDWREALHQMERVLNTQCDHYKECMGREHLLLMEAKDADIAFRIAKSIVPIYYTAAGVPRKNPYIARNAYTGKARDEYEKVFHRIQQMLGQFRSDYARIKAGREALSLLQLFHRAEERYQESKLREGVLDFDDLEIYAYRLLRKPESPDILYWLDRKILHFLVDEFQDTSDIQWAVLDKLTEEIFAGQGADKPMRPTLFVVGDEKQSIYRFREANYRLIENVREKIEKHIPSGSREILTLDKNFRSTPELIHTVNQVFTRLWGSEYKPSEADRKQHTGSVKLIELLPSSSDDDPPGPTEAEILAWEIKSLIENGTIIYERVTENPPPSPFPDKIIRGQVSKGGLNSPRSSHPPFDKGGQGGILPKGGAGGFDNGWTTRPANYGDCAVLIQSRTRLKEYEAALLKEGVPFRVVGGIGFYEEDEIQAVLNVLFFLWNRDDKHALAAALKSPLFGMTDKDIFDLLQDRGDLAGSLRRFPSHAGPLLDDWKRYASTEPLAGLIHRIIGDSGAYIRFGRRNQQAIFNLDKLLDTAREFDRRGYTTLQDFVEWVKNIRASEQREATADMNLPGLQGAVSIMTVHKAKGLEFPVVFLPGVNQQPKSISTGPPAIIEGDGGSVRLAVKDAANPVYDEMWGREREELRREHQRLLYVAMTRARDHLIMTGTLSKGKTPYKQNSWLSYFHEAGPKPLFGADVQSQPGLITYAYPPRASGQAKGEILRSQNDGRKEFEADEIDIGTVIRNLSPIPRSESLEWKRATDFIEKNGEDELMKPPLHGEVAAISLLTRGSVLHRCLEDFTKTGKYDLSRIIREFPDLETTDREVKSAFMSEADSILQPVLGRKEFAWIFERRHESYSELPFLSKRGGSLISGIMDRVVIKDRKGFVIDYKAILIENEDALKVWKDHYRPQLKVYCEAVKEIFKLESVEGYLLFLDSARLELTTEA